MRLTDRRIIENVIRPAKAGATTERGAATSETPGGGALVALQEWGSGHHFWLLGNPLYTFESGLYPMPSRGRAR